MCDITAIKVRNKQEAKMDVVSFNGENLSDGNNKAGSKDKGDERIEEESDSDDSSCSEDSKEMAEKHGQLL